jgi:hypothetical protein
MANGVDIIDGGLLPHPAKTAVRPVFMEPLPPRGVLLPRDGGHYRRGIIVSNDNRAVRMMRRSSSSSSFPIKDDAGYIGYLTDSNSDNRVTTLSRIVRDRRRELLGSDCDFTMTFFAVVVVVAVVVMATVAVGSAIIKH